MLRLLGTEDKTRGSRLAYLRILSFRVFAVALYVSSVPPPCLYATVIMYGTICYAC